MKTKSDTLKKIIDKVTEKEKEDKEELDSTDRIQDTIKGISERKFEFFEEEVENSTLSGNVCA